MALLVMVKLLHLKLIYKENSNTTIINMPLSGRQWKKKKSHQSLNYGWRDFYFNQWYI